MGLDVGVVKISYLDRPEQPIYNFLSQLICGAGCQYWGGSWEDNAFVELPRRHVLAKARVYARKQSLDKADSDKLIAWVKALPWDGDSIMLRLSW